MSAMTDLIFEQMEVMAHHPTRSDAERELISLQLHELKAEFSRLEKVIADAEVDAAMENKAAAPLDKSGAAK